MLVLRHATDDDRPALTDLLAQTNMYYVEPAEAYTLAFEGNALAGCARLEDHGDMAMLRPLVVAENYRRKGAGKYIIKNIVPDDKPTVIAARGESILFYSSIGFAKADWQTVSSEQRDECRLCPERIVCKPQPMIYIPERCKDEHLVNQPQDR